MYKIAAFIEFDKKITNKILSQKKLVKKKFGDQIYLKHPVHLTLFTLNIKKINELKKIYINDKGKQSKLFSISITQPGIFYNDPLTGGHTFFHHIKKNKTISEIQIKHLKKINKNLDVFKKNIKLFKNQKSDLLISSRYLPKSKIFHWSLSRRIFSKLSNILARIILNIKVSDYTNGFRIYSKNATKLIVKKCGKIGDGFIVLSEILLILDINKFKINEVSSIFINRVRGESSVNLKLIIQSFMGLIKLFFIKRNYKN